MSDDVVIKEYNNGTTWYKIYQSGLLEQGTKIYSGSQSQTAKLPVNYADTNYTVNVSNIPQVKYYNQYMKKTADVVFKNKTTNLQENQTPQVKYKPTTYKRVQALDADEDYIDYICPINKTVHTQGIPNPPISILKGPTKSATVELVTVENNVGTGGTANVNGITLNLAVNQFIRLKVDVNGAKIIGLPHGFTFANDEITGAGTTAGSYRCNIVTENVSIPVRINISNVIRIS